MTLHRRPDEEPDIDPHDPTAVTHYLEQAEANCRELCEHCGWRHDTKTCPNRPAPIRRVEEAA